MKISGIKKSSEQIKSAISKLKPVRIKKRSGPREEDMLSTGSTLLNLALSGNPRGGFMKGKYFLIVGDSSSGKTFLSMTCLAEAAKNPEFDGYQFIYDNVEDGMLMDVERLFGEKVKERIRPPAKGKEGEPIFSETIEDFYYHFDDAVKGKKPFIYILDSMDSLTSQDEEKKFEETKEATRKGKTTTGSYGDGKAKKNSSGIRKTLKGLRRTGSILIVISQTRDNLGAGPWGETKTRSGGKSLRFYATSEFWSSISETIKKTIRGRPRKVGVRVLLQIRKNRLTGELHTVETAIYPSYGIDDIGSCVDFLVEEKWWSKGSGGIKAKEFGKNLPKENLVNWLEFEGERLEKLQGIVVECWNAIAKASRLERKPRYE